jgi:hypothetical protein
MIGSSSFIGYGGGHQVSRRNDMLMPFGKYKGQDLSALPDEYLLWLSANIPLRDPLRSAVAEEITERGWELPPPPSASLPRPSQQQKRSRADNGKGAWMLGGDPQEIIAGDFPISSRHRGED